MQDDMNRVDATSRAPLDLDGVRFDERGLVPAIVQDAASGDVRMLGYMNRESLARSVQTGLLTFWSRSRQRLWQKGETSGNLHRIVSIHPDCDGDTLLVRVVAHGPTCHTGTETCFEGEPLVELPTEQGRRHRSTVVDEVAAVVAGRKANPVAGSYTSYLLEQGIDKIGKKIGEEAAEVIIAAKNGDPDPLANETSDLIYHLLVLLEATGVEPEHVWQVLSRRRGRPAPDHSSA